MRRHFVTVATGILVAAVLTPIGQSASAAPAPDALARGVQRQLAAGIQVAPKAAPGAKALSAGVNPFLAMVPDPTVVDYSRWNNIARTQGQVRANKMLTQQSLSAAVSGTATPRPTPSRPGRGTRAHRRTRRAALR